MVAVGIIILTLYLSQGASDYYRDAAEKQIALNLQLYGTSTVFYNGGDSDKELFKKMQERYGNLVQNHKSISVKTNSVTDGKIMCIVC